MQKCKYFNGLDKLVCEAGVRYEDMIRWTFDKDVWQSYREKDFPWVFPCKDKRIDSMLRLNLSDERKRRK